MVLAKRARRGRQMLPAPPVSDSPEAPLVGQALAAADRFRSRCSRLPWRGLVRERPARPRTWRTGSSRGRCRLEQLRPRSARTDRARPTGALRREGKYPQLNQPWQMPPLERLGPSRTGQEAQPRQPLALSQAARKARHPQRLELTLAAREARQVPARREGPRSSVARRRSCRTRSVASQREVWRTMPAPFRRR
jgi:hypothetical protein